MCWHLEQSFCIEWPQNSAMTLRAVMICRSPVDSGGTCHLCISYDHLCTPGCPYQSTFRLTSECYIMNWQLCHNPVNACFACKHLRSSTMGYNQDLYSNGIARLFDSFEIVLNKQWIESTKMGGASYSYINIVSKLPISKWVKPIIAQKSTTYPMLYY